MVYCVGLTGNIASGKSSVAELFAKKGIDVFNADFIARQLTQKDEEAYHSIVEHFSKNIVNKDGQLNRKLLREIIFANPQEKEWLESLLHPRIRKVLQQEVRTAKSPYCIAEIPLLKDKIAYPYINRILLVTASLPHQIERVMLRDHCTEEQALSILAAQPSVTARLVHAEDVIHNDFGFNELSDEVTRLHEQYLSASA